MTTRHMLVAGNWKMHTTSGEGAVLIQDIAQRVEEEWNEVEVAVCPPFTGLKAASTVIELDGLRISLGAQDVHWEAEGAYTGAISARMLTELRCDYVIVGHSERREFFGDTDQSVNKKVRAVFDAGMTPIMCCGEALTVREALETESFVRAQVTAGAAGLTSTEAQRLVIAYEPIWAIGTGRTPTPEAANDVCRSIRATIGAMYGPPAAMAVRVLYGGSVKPENAAMFFAEPDIDGALVGGAALKADPFADIVKAAR
ncbi:triose-phosphate isomerase [Anaerosoma tenue]|uniref:triose-phosphate isomerase n=1 Tax=Anaerosoma tenue TaxID=2933588 RepID=UPI002260EE6E|nr:triose-phosphate isomerase [Anaerosoma tenue]MCK8113923.1 triose-phosphate isomerase [Anaerosoma tenue]